MVLHYSVGSCKQSLASTGSSNIHIGKVPSSSCTVPPPPPPMRSIWRTVNSWKVWSTNWIPYIYLGVLRIGYAVLSPTLQPTSLRLLSARWSSVADGEARSSVDWWLGVTLSAEVELLDCCRTFKIMEMSELIFSSRRVSCLELKTNQKPQFFTLNLSCADINR